MYFVGKFAKIKNKTMKEDKEKNMCERTHWGHNKQDWSVLQRELELNKYFCNKNLLLLLLLWFRKGDEV